MVVSKKKKFSTIKGNSTTKQASRSVKNSAPVDKSSTPKTGKAKQRSEKDCAAKKQPNVSIKKVASIESNVTRTSKVKPNKGLQARDADDVTPARNRKNEDAKSGLSTSRGRDFSRSPAMGKNTARSPSTKRDDAPSPVTKRSEAGLKPISSGPPARQVNVAHPVSKGKENRPTRYDRPTHHNRLPQSQIRSMSPVQDRQMAHAIPRGRSNAGLLSTEPVRSLSPPRTRNMTSSPTMERGRARSPFRESSRRHLSPTEEKKLKAVKALMSKHLIPVQLDPDFGDEVETFKEPILRHIQLDDDISDESKRYGNLSQEICDRTCKGFDAFLRGDFNSSYQQYSRVNDLKWVYYANKHEKAVDSMIRMAMVLEAQGKMRSAIVQKKGALKMYSKLKINKVKLTDIFTSVGNSYFFQEQYEEALPFYEEALKRTIKYSQTSTNRSTDARINLGRTYAKLGESKDAIWHLENGLRSQKNSISTNDMDIAQTLVWIGDVHWYLKGKRRESNKAYSEALRIYKENDLKHDDPKMKKLRSRIHSSAGAPAYRESTEYDTQSSLSFEDEDRDEISLILTSCTAENMRMCKSLGDLAKTTGAKVFDFSCSATSGAIDKLNEFMLFDGACGKHSEAKNEVSKGENKADEREDGINGGERKASEGENNPEKGERVPN